jgi:hypothetical protein
MNNNYLIEKYSFLSKNLCDIFKNINNDIIEYLPKNVKTRKGKINYNDVFYYKMLYTFKNKTKQEIVSSINCNNNKNIDRTTFHKKDLKMNVNFYRYIFKKIKNLYDNNYKKNITDTVIAVDGTYNNTNINNEKGKLETSLNMGYYNVSEQIPIDITFCGQENKNKEILQLKKYIINNKFENLNNIIIVLDRAYYSFELINFLDSQKFNYVIRIKNNCTMIKNKNINNKINNKNVRIITYKDDVNKTKKDKNNNNVKIKETLECNIITNLNKDYTNDKIKNIYITRWDIEVFFKFIKSNFKFSRLDEHNNKNTKNEYEKLYYSMLINIYLITILEKINNGCIKKLNRKYNKNKNKNEYNTKNNKSLILKGLELILEKIINGKIKTEDFLKIDKNYIKNMNIIKNISNERKSKTPHSKWYVQSYAEYYRYLTIIEYLKGNKNIKLNKNLKLMLKNIKIIQ